MGDSTNLVLILAGELLKKAENLLVLGLHPSEVISGYELACEKALAELQSASFRFHFLKNNHLKHIIYSTALSVQTLSQPLAHDSLVLALKPAIASKQYGSEDILASLVAEAALSIMPSNPINFNVDNVRVVKIMGGGLSQSKVVRGMVFGREPEGQSTTHIDHVCAPPSSNLVIL